MIYFSLEIWYNYYGDKMVVRKLNYFRLISFIVVLCLIVFGIVKLVSFINYRGTSEYKLLKVGYSQKEVDVLTKELTKDEINKLLTMKKNSDIVSLSKEKYFIFKNIDKYLEYKKENDSIDNSDIVAIINTEANVDWLDNEKETDTSKGSLMLVNRIYGLPSDYEPDDIVDVPSLYAYTGKKISNSILNDIISLIEAGKEEGYTFVVSDGYRSYKEQENIYNNYKNSYGESEADIYVAKPGHSDYQTGMSFDLMPYNKVIDNPSESDEYKWLKDNAYKYGFIFRLPKDKEKLTRFKASTWRLRYVGTEASTVMHNENLCLEEYLAYWGK